MGRLTRLIEAIGIVLFILTAWLLCMGLFCSAMVYLFSGILAFGFNFSTHFGVDKIYVYASPFALLFAALGVNYIEEKVRGWFKVILELLSGLLLAIATELGWFLVIAGLLTGPRDSTTSSPHWVQWIAVHAPSLPNTTRAALIGAAVGFPLAVRMFYTMSPPLWYIKWPLKKRTKAPYRGREAINHRSAKTSSAARIQRALPLSVHLKVISIAIARMAISFLRSRSAWVGVFVGLGTLCAIAAGWSGGLTVTRSILAIMASSIAGILAALQWRLSSRQSLLSVSIIRQRKQR